MMSIVTPSCLYSQERVDLASESLASLRAAVGREYRHIVVDDLPRRTGILGRWLVNPAFRGAAERVYSLPNTTLIRRSGGGSASALLEAVRRARAGGDRYVFIHLDDNVYVPLLGTLLRHALSALEADPELVKVRLAGYPILWGGCTGELGNRSSLRISDSRVSFDRIELAPERHPEFTLWWSWFSPEMIGEKSYPVVLWSALYRAEVLESLLLWRGARRCRSLADVELFYLKPANWQAALRELPGKLGYVNMQYGGIEMEHNRDWARLIGLPNEPVL